ncbi:MAG: N-acetylmuramoyl-L-alanine amidase [Elusimicrobia bacterium]|nr:N-acetylmuramoyl-L-alanine amidase [Elusimicrobiota bacterium]
MRNRALVLAPAVLLVSWAAAARAQGRPGRGLAAFLQENARALSADGAVPVPDPETPPAPPTPSSVPLDGATSRVNFEYADMVDRMEKLRRVVIGRHRHKRVVDTGVTPADRVDRGEIRYVVLHASGGATGKPGACEGSVAWLLKRPTAAHFMVCRDGRVIRMVRIEDIANQVKNDAVDRAAIGIETETGHPEADAPFLASDWDPDSYWRLYASLAWLIRAIAREADLPRDRAHVITHEEADRGLPRAHVDPGPFFDGATYPAFDARFPGQGVTPREFLMRLIADDAPPRIWAAAGGAAVEVKDTDMLGLAHLSVYALDPAGRQGPLVAEWAAPPAGLPPALVSLGLPEEPGAYRVVARDLVGNTSAGLVRVPAVAPAAP